MRLSRPGAEQVRGHDGLASTPIEGLEPEPMLQPCATRNGAAWVMGIFLVADRAVNGGRYPASSSTPISPDELEVLVVRFATGRSGRNRAGLRSQNDVIITT